MADWLTSSAESETGANASGALADDAVKLVGYFVVSIQRGRERVMPDSGDTIIVTSNMTDEAFTSMAVGRYLQKARGRRPNLVLETLECLARTVADVAADATAQQQLADCARLLAEERLNSQRAALADQKDDLAAGEERYLRVHFAVIRRWPREPLKFAERQHRVLEQIRDEL